jgi:hypothetical protein
VTNIDILSKLREEVVMYHVNKQKIVQEERQEMCEEVMVLGYIVTKSNFVS